MAEPAPDRGLDAPTAQPAFTPSSDSTGDLAALVPPTKPTRDPRAPFDVITSTLTDFSTKTPDKEWKPTDPLGPATAPSPITMPSMPAVAPFAHVNPPGFPAPGTPQWFAPGTPQQPKQHRSLNITEILNAATPPVLILCLVGGLFSSLSFLCLVIALVATARIAYRRRAVNITTGVTAALLALDAVVAIARGDDLDLFFEALTSLSRFLCWGVMIALLIIVTLALSNDEQPTKRV